VQAARAAIIRRAFREPCREVGEIFAMVGFFYHRPVV